MTSADDRAPPRGLPQTLPALLLLLSDQGRDPQVAVQVRAAHEVAVMLTSGRFRVSAKPFVCHLVGTAAALTAAGASGDLIAAGLLHAVYAQGEWGDGLQGLGHSAGGLGLGSAKRARLRALVGDEVEARVARYTMLDWSLASIIALDGTRLGSLDRDVVAMRLANEVDDHLDLGILYGELAEERRALANQALPHWLRLARELGHEPLAELLHATVPPAMHGRVPSALRTGARNSYLVAPLSHRVRPLPRLRQLAATGVHELHRAAIRTRDALRAAAKLKR